MKNEDIIKAAKTEITSKLGYRYDPDKLVATVEAGLQDGDCIFLGAGRGNVKMFGEIDADTFRLVAKKAGNPIDTKEIPFSKLTEDQIASALKHKAIAASQL